MLAASGGVGGGGLLIPIYMLVLGKRARSIGVVLERWWACLFCQSQTHAPECPGAWVQGTGTTQPPTHRLTLTALPAGPPTHSQASPQHVQWP